jgi:hypothetical protein
VERGLRVLTAVSSKPTSPIQRQLALDRLRQPVPNLATQPKYRAMPAQTLALTLLLLLCAMPVGWAADAGIGPVLAFCETAITVLSFDFSIEAEVPRRRIPAILPRRGVAKSN